jgi:hypothetical protein
MADEERDDEAQEETPDTNDDDEDVMHASEDITFERFRIEYEKLSRALLRSLDTEKKLLGQCRELKSDLIQNATRLKVALKLKLEDDKTLDDMREEVQAAWKSADLSKEKEKAAQKLVLSLQDELGELKMKTKEMKSHEVDKAMQIEEEDKEELLQTTNLSEEDMQIGQPLASFEDWKRKNHIWTPSYNDNQAPAGQAAKSTMRTSKPSTSKSSTAGSLLRTSQSAPRTAPGGSRAARSPMERAAVGQLNALTRLPRM